ncbi:MAG TPA: conjugative transposon protein TraM [Puia sp.]|nr:conjugative transposon protein TraM [Puia sp.]
MIQLTQRKFLLLLPAAVLPVLTMLFYGLGGGRGDQKTTEVHATGLNMDLPGAYPDPKKVLMNKMGAYLHADEDSLRKKEYAQQDPYVNVSRKPVALRPVGRTDPKAEELLARLNQLKESLQQPPPERIVARTSLPEFSRPVLPRERPADTAAGDPQLERLNTMLDKVIRIQHPGESRSMGDRSENGSAELVMPADSASNAIAAVVPTDQRLVNGTTLPLRLAEDVLMHGVVIPAGEWVYGVVTISNDRMLVHIRSIRSGRNLYPTDLQVYDLDGLAGIHIPDMLSQDVAKESAGESVSGINVISADPTPGAQVANAGIQAAKSLFGRKVRLVRVAVRAGYAVLLRNPQRQLFSAANKPTFFDGLIKTTRPPGFVPGGPFLQRCRTEGVELGLRGIYLQDSLLWFSLEWRNRSPIGFVPAYCRWVIRDRRHFRRTAQQELPLTPSYAPEPTSVAGDSSLCQWTGFRPFVLGRDKELVLEAEEKGGGRVLILVIDHKQILNAKTKEP